MKATHKVVILEDDIVLANILKQKVNAIDGFSCVFTFSNPQEYFSAKPATDIMLLDVVMPVMSGLDAIETILQFFPDASIIMNTIKDDSETIMTALKKGAVAYIDKQSFDFNLQIVLHAVANGGAYMTPKIARKVFQHFQKPAPKIGVLTKREMDVTNGILEGLSYKLIAHKYDISIDTVRMNIRSIYKKLNINSKSQLFHMSKM